MQLVPNTFYHSWLVSCLCHKSPGSSYGMCGLISSEKHLPHRRAYIESRLATHEGVLGHLGQVWLGWLQLCLGCRRLCPWAALAPSVPRHSGAAWGQ